MRAPRMTLELFSVQTFFTYSLVKSVRYCYCCRLYKFSCKIVSPNIQQLQTMTIIYKCQLNPCHKLCSQCTSNAMTWWILENITIAGKLKCVFREQIQNHCICDCMRVPCHSTDESMTTQQYNKLEYLCSKNSRRTHSSLARRFGMLINLC